jgi:hypothetical protein
MMSGRFRSTRGRLQHIDAEHRKKTGISLSTVAGAWSDVSKCKLTVALQQRTTKHQHAQLWATDVTVVTFFLFTTHQMYR